MAKEQGIPKLWEKIKEILNNLANKISKNGDTMTGTLTITNPSANFSVRNVENGQTILENPYTAGVNNYLGGVATQWYNEWVAQGVWRGGGEDISHWGLAKNGTRVLHYDFNSSEFVVPNFKATGNFDVRAYADFYATINARTEGNSKIMSRGSASSWSGSARSNSGFHVGQDGGALTVPNVTSTFTKGYQIETVTDGIGYIARTSIGHLRSGNADWGSTAIYFEGDAEGQDAKHWWFHHNNGQFETAQLRVSGMSEFNTAMYSSSPSPIISNVTGMHLHSNSGLIGFLNSSGSWILHVDNAGNMVTISNTTAFSDIKLKKDLEVIPNAIEKIQAINGYTYTRKDTGERQAGVVAQEIQKVLPEVVLSNKDENGDETLSVAYGNIVSLLIEGIKEQQSKIDSLEERICKLEKLLEVI